MANQISEVTRRDIFDFFTLDRIVWFGRLDEVEFLSRLYDLNSLPSDDSRFDNAAGDVWQHCINNDDWPLGWIYTDKRFNLMHCGDGDFLSFLCEIVHPVVRPNSEEAQRITAALNDALKKDGFELYPTETIAGRNKYGFRNIYHPKLPNFVKEIQFKLDSSYIERQIRRMEDSIESDPDSAIGAAKELIETICKTILHELGDSNQNKYDFTELVKSVRTKLNLLPANIDNEKKGAEAFKKVLQAASSMIDSMGEIRNLYGTGHGKFAHTKGLEARHARLVVGIAGTLGRFFFDCYERQYKN